MSKRMNPKTNQTNNCPSEIGCRLKLAYFPALLRPEIFVLRTSNFRGATINR